MSTRQLVNATSRQVIKKILSREQSEGVGATVRRSIGTSQLRSLDPFLMLDQFSGTKSGGGNFPDHPHRGIQTVTYMLEGQFEHEDFLGNYGVLAAGDLQFMTAGRGIVHSENQYGDGLNTGLQLWVNLKYTDKMMPPQYDDLKKDQIPIARPAQGHVVKVIAGQCADVKSPVRTVTPVYYFDWNVEEGVTEEVFQEIPQGWTAFVYTLTGKITFGNGKEVYDPHHTLVFSNDSAEGIVIKPVGQAARFVLICGQPIGEPIVQHGPVVMNTQSQIQEFFQDYSQSINGFEAARNWQSKYFKSLKE